jgi:predicted Fe-Mo cluster-binding NifX family protein
MKIAVSARGNTLDSAVDERFGRAAGFLIYDSDSGGSEFLDNSTRQTLSQNAGIQAAQAITAAGTDVLLTGQMGPKAAQILRRSGVALFACSTGTVREALRAWEQNALNELGDEAVQPGPGKRGGRGMGGGGRGRGPSGGGRGMGGGGRGGGRR